MSSSNFHQIHRVVKLKQVLNWDEGEGKDEGEDKLVIQIRLHVRSIALQIPDQLTILKNHCMC